MKRIPVFSLVLLCLFTSLVRGEIELEISSTIPAPGLQQFTLTGIGTEGERLNGLGGLNITGDVHQVWSSNGLVHIPSTSFDDVTTNSNFLADWKQFDTHMLFPGSDILIQIGPPSETNDGSDPFGLGLEHHNPDQDPLVGLGTYGQSEDSATALFPAGASDRLDFLQVVVPSRVGVTATFTLLAGGLSRDYFDWMEYEMSLRHR